MTLFNICPAFKLRYDDYKTIIQPFSGHKHLVRFQVKINHPPQPSSDGKARDFVPILQTDVVLQ